MRCAKGRPRGEYQGLMTHASGLEDLFDSGEFGWIPGCYFVAAISHA